MYPSCTQDVRNQINYTEYDLSEYKLYSQSTVDKIFAKMPLGCNSEKSQV